MYNIYTVSAPLSAGGQLSVPNFQKRGMRKKTECLGGLKEFLPWIFAWGASFFVKKIFKRKLWFASGGQYPG